MNGFFGLLAVAAGGALGAAARHLTALAVGPRGFPYAILTANVLGSFLIGLLAGAFAYAWDAPQHLRAFLVVGVLGGFTTFSSFSLDVALMIERGQIAAAALYVGASVILAVGATFVGLAAARGVWA